MACQETDELLPGLQPTYDQPSEEYKLYVDNLPSELTEDGIKQIFDHYGKIIGIFTRTSASWAYITYGKYSEAEYAIRDLNGKPPLRLRVTFAKQKPSQKPIEVKVADNCEEPINYHVHDFRYSDMHGYTIGRGKPLDTLYKQPPVLSAHRYTTEDDLLYPVPVDPYMYNPYENAEPYASTNSLWTRGQMNITRDGRRLVSLGRGYNVYEIPKPHPKVEDHIQALYEQRSAGLFKYNEDKLQHKTGNCSYCRRVAKLSCERCHEFYCSRQCQIKDWPRHQLECQSIPALVKTMDDASLSQSSSEENVHQSMTKTPLRRPKIDITKKSPENVQESEPNTRNRESCDKLNVQNNFTMNKSNSPTFLQRKRTSSSNDSDQKITRRDSPKQTSPRDSTNHMQNGNNYNNDQNEREKTPHSDRNQCPDQPQKDFRDSVSPQGIKRPESTQKNLPRKPRPEHFDVKKVEEIIDFQRETFLYKTDYTNVQIILEAENCEYWVQKVNDQEALQDMMIMLLSKCDKMPKIQPVMGKICAAKYEGVWHRAIITSLNPLKVHYIDYGNEEMADINDCCEIPSDITKLPRFARKIRVSEAARRKYNIKPNDILSVRLVSIDMNKVMTVEIEKRVNSRAASIASSGKNSGKSRKSDAASKRFHIDNKIPCMTEFLREGMKGVLHTHILLSNDTYGLTVTSLKYASEFQQILCELPEECEQLKEHKPNVGELVCGKTIDEWYRGYVSSLSPPQLILIDESRIVPVYKIVECPQKYMSICAFGAECKVLNNQKLKVGFDYDMNILSCKKSEDGENILLVEINDEDDNQKIQATVKPWKPVPEQKGLQYAELKSGTEVCLTAFRSHVLLYARPLEHSDLEYHHKIMQSVAKCAQSAPALKALPVVGQMLLSRFEDGNYYRAIVTKVEDEQKIIISYIDFGNVDKTTIETLKELPDHLKEPRSCTAKIYLKDVAQDVPMTKEVHDYLSQLTGAEVPLKCKFDGIPSKDGVYLTLTNGQSVNEKVASLLKPTWEKPDETDKTCYTFADMPFASLGEVGEVTDAIVLSQVDGDAGKYVICPFDTDLMTHIYEIMPAGLNKYCPSAEKYIPRNEELCLAIYKGEWYRAVCVNRSSTPNSATVFFIDYGNVDAVDHKDLRAMTADFMKPAALANICTVVNLAPMNQEGKYSAIVKRRISELVSPNCAIKVKVIGSSKHGEYTVEFPDVRETLIKEGLVSVS